MSSERILGNMLAKYVVKPMQNEECGFDDDELAALAEVIGSKKLTMEQAANFLNADPTTLRRKVRNGELPKPRKVAGGKKYFLIKDLKNG